jgi:hypothetical protein
MYGLAAKASGHVARFAADRSGATAILFALSFIPALALTGIVVDSGRLYQMKTDLQSAADAAALAAAKADPAVENPADVGKRVFNANLSAAKINFDLGSVTVKLSTEMGGRLAKVEYDGKVKLMFPSVLGDGDTFKLKGASRALQPLGTQVDIFALVDNSTSMGLMANEAGRDWLKKTVGCAFACHIAEPGHEHKGKSYYQVAKEGGWETRFDIVKKNLYAMVAMLDEKKDNKKNKAVIRFGMYAMNDYYSKEIPVTEDLDKARKKIDDFNLKSPKNASWTRFERYMGLISKDIGKSSDGINGPRKFAVIVTDGVRSNWDKGNAGFHAFNPTWCNDMKENGVNVIVLFTRYVPMPTEGVYNTLIKPWHHTLEGRMKDCASPGLFFPATEDKEIEKAFRQIIEAFEGQLRVL